MKFLIELPEDARTVKYLSVYAIRKAIAEMLPLKPTVFSETNPKTGRPNVKKTHYLVQE